MTLPDSNPHSLVVTRTLEAPRNRVFDAWLDADALATFMRPAAGVEVPHAEADPKEGGQFLVVMKVGPNELPHRGEYKVIDRPSRLEFTWISEHAGDGSHVTLELEELSPDRTRLTLRHDGLPSQASRDNHERGWTRIAEKLNGELGTEPAEGEASKGPAGRDPRGVARR